MALRKQRDFPWWDATFWLREKPRDHFDTPSSLCGPLLARLLMEWVRRLELRTVVDLGCGDGVLLSHLSTLSQPDISLIGIDVRNLPDRPGVTHRRHYWSVSNDDWESPFTGSCAPEPWPATSGPILAIAVEWLDDLPAVVASTRADGSAVEITPCGADRPLSGPDAAWLRRWWPGPGRAVVGRTRDEAWHRLAENLPPGSVLATIDYGHVRGDRPPDGGLGAHRHGRATTPGTAGNVTAAVAVDALAAAAEQAGAQGWWFSRLADLPKGFWPIGDDRPLTRLALRTQEHLLTDPHRFGGFWLVAHRIPGRPGSGSVPTAHP